jgi:hypothetical protein
LLLESPKTGKTTAFEVKVSPVAPEAEAQIRRLLETAQSKNYEFRLVTINRPTRYSITIDRLDDALFQYLIDHPLEELDELSTHTEYDRISTQIRSIRINDSRATVTLDGTIDLILRYGSASDRRDDDGFAHPASVPFEGEVTLDLTAKQVTAARFQVDLSLRLG